MNVARFIAFCGKLEYGRSRCIFAYISMTTRARDFKFAGTPVQRLQLAMVALTQKSFSVQYAWFSRGGSHISMLHHTSCIPIIPNDSKIHNIICFIILTLHNWSKPKRAPHKSTL